MRRLCGGGGGLQVHNHATSWPNLQDGTCKNSIQIEFQVGPECGKNNEKKLKLCQAQVKLSLVFNIMLKLKFKLS